MLVAGTMATGEAKGVLDGVRIVEVGWGLAAPVVGMLLAEQGADVLRVVDPAQPGIDPVLDALLARGKTEAPLSTGTPEGREALLRFLSSADVFLEDPDSATPEVLRALVSRAREVNPGLVTCRIPAFPDGDPRCALPGYEAVAGTAGQLYGKPLGAPRYHPFPIASVMAGLFAANAVVAALVGRMRTGVCQDIVVSRYHSALFAQILQVLMKTGVPRGFLPLKMVGTPFMRAWRCKDGRYAYLHITLPAHAARVLDVLDANGHGETVRKLRAVLSADTMRDPSQVGSIGEARRIIGLYERVFLERTADEWESVLGRELCCIKVRTVEEWLHDSLEAGMSDAAVVDDPVFGPLTGPGPGVTSPDRPQVIRARRVGAPAVAEALARWQAGGTAAADGVTGPDGKPPLHGFRVADLSRIIAGPCSARVLAELGADVLTVQNPTALDWALSFHLMFNAGKRSVTLDFTGDEGKRRLWAILDDLRPDVLVQNYRNMDVARAVGVDPDSVRARFPDIVYTHLNSYGDRGVWKDRPGFEQIVQAVSGIQVTYGIDGQPKLLPTPVIDIGSGLTGALASVLGLYHRAKTGHGIGVTTHLTWVSVLLQVREVAAFQRGRCLDAAAARGAAVEFDPGRQILSGIVGARGGHVTLAGPRADLLSWAGALGIAPADAADDPVHAIGQRLRWKRVDAWQASVRAAGVAGRVAVVPVAPVGQLIDEVRRTDPDPVKAVSKRPYPGCPTELTFVRSPLRMARPPLPDIAPPGARGTDTRAVLARLGVDVPEGTGVIPYPPDKPFIVWLVTVIRWGWFAWRSGNI